MQSRKLGLSLRWQAWEELSEEQLVKKTSDRIQVYLNHEDSDFPFDHLAEDGFAVERGHEISIDVVDFRENREKLSLTLSLSFVLKQLKVVQGRGPTGATTRTVRFEIDLKSDNVEAFL